MPLARWRSRQRANLFFSAGAGATHSPPVATLSGDRPSVGVGVAASFSVTASDPDQDVLACAWDFGDNTLRPNSPYTTKNWNAAGWCG